MTVTPFGQSEALPVPNVPLLRKVYEHLGAHSEEWDQTQWRAVHPCGTTYCFAGFAAYFDGAEWCSPESESALISGESVETRAERVLGLTPDEADELFYVNNSLADIDRVLTAIYARARHLRAGR